MPGLLRDVARPDLMDGLLQLRHPTRRRPLIESAMTEWFPLESREVFLELTDPSFEMRTVANYLLLLEGEKVAENASEALESGGRNEALRSALILARAGWSARESLLEGTGHSLPGVRQTCMEGLVALIGPGVSVTA